MSSPISRRTLAKGAAWAAPVVATTAAVPAYAASSCLLTAAELAAGVCDSRVAAVWETAGAQTYSSSGGPLIDVNTQMNIGFVSTCNYKGSVTLKMHNNTGEKYIPAASLTLTDGTVYSGHVSLSNVLTGGAKAGFSGTFTMQWDNSAAGKAGKYPSNWSGAKVRIPMELSYSDNGVHTCMIQLEFTMTAGYKGTVQAMGNPTIVSYTS